VRGTYEPTVVPYGLTGFTAGLQEMPWDEAQPTYRQDFEQRHGASGRSWQEVEPVYRFGHEMRSDPRFASGSWDEAEPQLRVIYVTWRREAGYGDDDGDDDTAWSRSRDHMREVWQRHTAR